MIMTAKLQPGGSDWRRVYWWACDKADLVVVSLVPGVKIQVARAAVPAVWELGARFRLHSYEVRPGVTGAYNCRPQTGSNTVMSSHAYGIAVDVNWDTNPYNRVKLVTDMPRAMIEDIEAIRTTAGVQVWRWGGDWDGRPETPHSNYDAMHFELVATPAQLLGGFTISMDPSNVRSWRTLFYSKDYPVMTGPAVRLLEHYLGVPETGRFTEDLKRVVVSYQLSRKIDPDGVVGNATWTLLFHALPPVHSSAVPPSKGQVPFKS